MQESSMLKNPNNQLLDRKFIWKLELWICHLL